MSRCHQQILQKYHTTYIFISSKILFFIIYCFKVCLFFIKEAVVLSLRYFKIFAPLQETEHSDLWFEHPRFFDVKVDRTGNPRTNILNILEFSSAYVSDFTAHTCCKSLNKSLFTDKRTRKNTPVANSIPTKCLKFASRCLESSLAHWVKCREPRSVLDLLQKNLFVC